MGEEVVEQVKTKKGRERMKKLSDFIFVLYIYVHTHIHTL